jgi:DNA repair exonuclease SbcCD nuclease subunit
VLVLMKLKLNDRKVCCVSDIHIGVHQNSQMWHDITVEWAGWLSRELDKHGVTDILIPGDLFHYRDEIAVNTIHVTTQILNMWKRFNIVILVGNHDAYYKDKSDINSLSILSGWDNITVVSQPTQYECFNRKLMFCPWGTEPEQIMESDIVFGHFEIQSFRFNQHKVCEDGIKSESILSKTPLVITGHFHLREERVYKNGKILYLGNPYQMDFGDVNGIKGYYLLDIVTGDYDFYVNDISPTHQKIKLSELVAHGSLTDEVREMFANNIVKLIIDRQVAPDDMDLLLKKYIELNAKSITADYDITFNKFGLEDENDHDLSGVDVTIAIEEFINMLEDVDDKQQIIDYTVDLYRKYK